MKNKKMFLPNIIIISGIVISIITSLLVCIAKKPAITEYSFPFSITYEFNGKTETIKDEFICTYTERDGSFDSANRYYEGYLAQSNTTENRGDYLIQSYEDGDLVIYTNFFAGYMMGDPQYADHYTEYYRYEPYVAFYVYEDYMEYEDAEHLAPYDVKIVDWEYPQPLENKFVFDGITRLTSNNVLPMLAVSLLTLLVCIIFVKKDQGLTFGVVDKFPVILNFIIAFAALPFMTIVSLLIEIAGGAGDISNQIAYCVPAVTGFGLAASVSLRRKGYKKAGFAAQFAGIVLFVFMIIIDILI